MFRCYCGEYFDSETGTIYLRARYYDPVIGRFISQDGWGFIDVNDPLSLNLYTYCGNDPLNYYDESGNFRLPKWVKWIGKKIAKGASVAADTAIHEGNWYLNTMCGIDTAAAGAYVLDMDIDTSGVYHAREDCWQQYGGYNSFYDGVFDFATDMKTSYFEFSYGDQDYRFWAWKGDYINMGAGAELGIYTRMSVGGFGTDHWLVDTSLALPMSMTLKDNKGNLLAFYSPSKSQWWITSFNPNFSIRNANNLIASFTINFTGNIGMYNAFIKSRNYLDNKKNWSVSKDNKYLLTFTF